MLVFKTLLREKFAGYLCSCWSYLCKLYFLLLSISKQQLISHTFLLRIIHIRYQTSELLSINTYN